MTLKKWLSLDSRLFSIKTSDYPQLINKLYEYGFVELIEERLSKQDFKGFSFISNFHNYTLTMRQVSNDNYIHFEKIENAS